MAARDPFHSQPGTPDHTPFADGFNRILRAGGSVPAMRAQHRRQHELIEANGQYEEFLNQIQWDNRDLWDAWDANTSKPLHLYTFIPLYLYTSIPQYLYSPIL